MTDREIRAQYITEDGKTVFEGDLVYDYYSMEPVKIGKPSGSSNDDPWFEVERPEGGRATAGILNGSRICTIAYAQRRGFPKANNRGT